MHARFYEYDDDGGDNKRNTYKLYARININMLVYTIRNKRRSFVIKQISSN